MKKNLFTLLSAVVLTSATFVACNNEGDKKPAADTATVVKKETMEPKMDAPKDIVDVAMGSADHTTLVAALKAAGLVETLKGAGPFTVFAPTNAAFSALPAGTLQSLLLPENKAKLAGILTYHVVAGKIMSTDLTDGIKGETLNGEQIIIGVKEGKVTVNGANVTTADLGAGNGVVHVIDAVLMPKR